MKVLSFGELLLRLSAPGYSRFLQKDIFESSFCGGEANVAVSLAMFGINSAFLTKLPENDIGKAATNSLRYFGVDTSKIFYGDGRMGIYYLEKGASQRPSKIIYDRKYSAVSLSNKSEYNWKEIFSDITWFHWTGINPALSDEMMEICFDACKYAKSHGITVSCDLNYRSSLWSSYKAQKSMKSIMPYVDVCIANEEDAEKVLGIKKVIADNKFDKINKNGYIETAKIISSQYKCKYIAITLRESYSASRNGWSGMLYVSDSNKAYFSKTYDIQVVDRVGGGDSFSAALIYSLISNKENQETIDFAVAASCLKHTVEGDFNRVSVNDVEKLLSNGGNGRIVR